MSDVLEQLGLSKREPEVYRFLLRNGESPVSDIIKEFKIHSQLIYRVLDELLEKKLVTINYRRHRKYFRAEDPRLLKKYEEERLKLLDAEIPQLLALQSTSKEAIIRVAKGNEAVRALRVRSIDELTPQGCQYVIGASGDRYYEILGDLYTEVERKRIKKGIPKKLISFESQRKRLEKNDTMRGLAEFRFLPQQYSIPATTNIFNDTVALLIWEKDPIVITIESAAVAQSYLHYFNSLWDIAKV